MTTNRFDKFAAQISGVVGSPSFFIGCVILTVLPFVLPQTITMVQFISSGFLQLVLLPLMVMNQNVAAKKQALYTSREFSAETALNKEELASIKEIIKNMPYKSQAQEKFFNAHRSQMKAKGVNVDEWNASSKGKKLPKRVTKKKK